ncbi:PAAR-like domain-containing protein [Aureimonas leprariae]|uniref:DUF4150 domain-containing protein n=1 Tax=Plantimonas leprariae TaxID=2615207 RepID=A0A7V7PLU1_9HYPH|nr:PAAR-like domain-containing protein [Aureimonas leprariae]KAB0677369.1 DUF4150 domain-containing protein [Aureimonas leprariae]
MSNSGSGAVNLSITRGTVIDVGKMSPDVRGAYDSALKQGDDLFDTDPDAARAAWARADEIGKPYIRRPPPTAASPPPPELVPDTKDAVAVCLSPDVCRSPSQPVPYQVWGKGDDDQNYSPDVRSNGLTIKRRDSRFTTTYGDEPGTGLGVKSNTVGNVVEPVTSSTIVRANGVPVQRHTDRCTLNNGNCPGEYVHVKSTETHEPPDGKDKQDKAWYQKAWDWTGDKLNRAGNAVGKWVDEHPRTMGAVQAVGGVAEGIGSAALVVGGTAADATVVGAPVGIAGQALGVAGLVNASDNVSTGLRQMWYGTPQQTVAVQATGAAASALGATPAQTQTAQSIVSGGQVVLGGVAGGAGALRQAGRATAVESGIAKEAGTASKARAAEETADEAVVSGNAGARSTPVSRWKRNSANGRRVYQRDDLIDPKKVDDRGRTNLERMQKGLAPLGPDGKPVNLHHLTQDEPGAIAEVGQTFHKDNHGILHMYPNGQAKVGYNSAPPPIDRQAFGNWARSYWKTRASDFK